MRQMLNFKKTLKKEKVSSTDGVRLKKVQAENYQIENILKGVKPKKLRLYWTSALNFDVLITKRIIDVLKIKQ